MSLHNRLSFADFFTWIALGDGDLRFSLILIKANVVEGGTTSATCLYHQNFQFTFSWSPTPDKCGHGLSVPNHVKLEIVVYYLC
jgi:hypothetical protein